MKRIICLRARKRNLYGFLALLFLLLGITPAMAYANSAEPPALVIIMKNAPEFSSDFFSRRVGKVKPPVSV